MSLLLLLCALAGAAPIDDVRESLGHYVADEAAADRLVNQLQLQAAASEKRLAKVGPSAGVADQIVTNAALNLRAKEHAGLPMTQTEIERTVFGYEAFKMEAYVTSGVFPKRYFGYFDGKGDTAAHERRLRTATSGSVRAINAWQKAQGRTARLTDQEVSVTWIAEGGAIHLGEQQQILSQGFHPVFDVGLDDIAMGVADAPELMAAIDKEAGTQLVSVVGWWEKGQPSPPTFDGTIHWLKHGNGDSGPHAYLARKMTFEEAIAGTALMYIWEKEIAERKMAAIGAAPLMGRTLDEQFVISSLVYNSGLLHKPLRWELIGELKSASWIYGASESNATRRWRLNVLSAPDSLQKARTGGGYPNQPTAWLAGYHVLQRYGAFEAMQRFTDVFNEDGSFRSFR